MQSLCEVFYGSPSYGSGDECCYDKHYRRTYHGKEQRYVSPTTGRCKPLEVQAIHPIHLHNERIEIHVGDSTPPPRKLAVWLVLNLKPELIPVWLVRWAWYTITLLWPFQAPRYTGSYPAYLSQYYGQLWAARSPHEYSLRNAQLGPQPVREVTHSTHPRRLVIYDPSSRSWNSCMDEETIKQQKYVVISYRYKEVVPNEEDEAELVAAFITEVEATIASLNMSAYWIDLTLTAREEEPPPQEVDKDLFQMADIYRGAEFTLIMLRPLSEISEMDAWLEYGRRLWTLPEALLSRELRYKFRGGEVTLITLHQLANRAYVGFPQKSAIVNAYGQRDPLERLERLSLLKSALWNRTSSHLERLAQPGTPQHFRADRVYALMGFFEHRIHPHFQESELQALARLSMANDNDRLVERMVSLFPHQLSNNARWYAEDDVWGANLWDIEPEIQVVGLTEQEALVIGGCRAAAIHWKNFPLVAFAQRPSLKRAIAAAIPFFSWILLFVGIILKATFDQSLTDASLSNGFTAPQIDPSISSGFAAPLIIGIVLMLFAPLLTAYGTSGRIVLAQPWLVGVRGLISAEEASTLMYGGAIYALLRTSYTPSGTPLSQPEVGRFRRGHPDQLKALRPQVPNTPEDHDLYTLVDTLSGTIYYFRAARPPTVCLYTGRESGMGRFVLCSERCIDNVLQKEVVIRMPWYISQSMAACEWVALK